VDTNTYAAELFGKELKLLKHISIGPNEPSISHNEHLQYKVEPDVFTRLEKPDTSNPWASAILYQGGKVFECMRSADHPEGRSFMQMRFSRGK